MFAGRPRELILCIEKNDAGDYSVFVVRKHDAVVTALSPDIQTALKEAQATMEIINKDGFDSLMDNT